MKLAYLILVIWGYPSTEIPEDRIIQASELLATDLTTAQAIINETKSLELTAWERSRLLFVQGYIYDEQNKLYDALINYHESIRFLDKSKNTSETARYSKMSLLKNIGRIYHHFSEYDMAIKYYEEAAKYADYEEMPGLQYNVALTYSKSGNDSMAVNILLKAHKVTRELKQYNRMAMIHNKIGTIMRDIGDINESSEHFWKVIHAKDFIKQRYLAQAHHNLALTLWKKYDYAAAEEHFNKAIDLKPSQDQYKTKMNLCEMYLEAGDLKRAIETGLLVVQDYPMQIKNPENFQIFAIMANAYESANMYDSALAFAKIHVDETIGYYELNQRSLQVDEAYWIKMMTDRYFNQVQMVEQKKNFITGSLIALFVVLVFVLIFILYRWKSKKILVREIKDILNKSNVS